MSGVLLAALAALLVLVAGGAPLHVPAGPLLGRVGGATLAGLVALHLGLTVADPFTAWTGGLAVGLALLAALVWRMGVPRCELPRLSRPGWGLVVAALPLALYGALASVPVLFVVRGDPRWPVAKYLGHSRETRGAG